MKRNSLSFLLPNRQTLCGLALSSLLINSVLVYAQQTPRPTDRWRANSNGSYLGDLNTPVRIDNVLPQLSENGIVIGEADVRISADGLVLTVEQNPDSPRILAYWDSYNIGAENTVHYVQSDSDSLALNIIQQQSPSAIFGALNCDAACWLVNPNGIFFGDGAQINSRGLLAAAMEFTGVPMDIDLVDQTVTNWFARENLFDGIDNDLTFLSNARDHTTDPDDGDKDLPRVIVAAGAHITSDSAPVLLAGPEVINEGNITSNNGQVVMAGSRQDVYLALTDLQNPPGVSNAARKDLSYRGFLVEVNSGAGTERGAVVNAGEIVSNFGNVTLVAADLLQAGKIKSSTAVDVNGTVRLLARDQAQVDTVNAVETEIGKFNALYYEEVGKPLPFTSVNSKVAIGREAGNLTLAQNSSIEVSIDQSNATGTDADAFSQPRSQINLEGRYVVMEDNASIVAPSGEVTIRARENPIAILNDPPSVTSDAFFAMQEGSVIDVSGTTDTLLSADRNVVEFFLTSNEFKDAPEQKGGDLLRESVVIDIRTGTPLFDWTVALDNVAKTANERAALGGNVSILADTQAIMADNSIINVSGGRVNYEAGYIETSRLIGENGLVDIGQADPLETYFGVFKFGAKTLNDAKWGKINSFRPTPGGSNRRYRDAYYEGFAAGDISIVAASSNLSPSASLLAQTPTGQYQRDSNGAGGNVFVDYRLANEEFTIALLNPGGVAAEDATFTIEKSLIENSGAGLFSLRAQNGSIEQSADVDLHLTKGSSLKLSANNLLVEGNIRAEGGDITLEQTGSGSLLVSGVLDSSGNWTNDTNIGSAGALNSPLLNPIITDAGNISLKANAELIIADGAKFIANGGAWLSAESDIQFGSAGNINFIAKQNSGQPSLLTINTPLRAMALDNADGGLLSFEVASVNIGEFTDTTLTQNLNIDNSFFEQTLVGGYSFSALNGNVELQSSASINLSHGVLNQKQNHDFVASSNSVFDALQVVDLPNYLAPSASLQFGAYRQNASNDDAGSFIFNSGAEILGTVDSSLSIAANNRIFIDGAVRLPGSRVSAVLTQIEDGPAEDPTLGNYIFVGDNADLDLSAYALQVPTNNNETRLFRSGDAGSLSLDARFGYALVAQGAEIDLSGKVITQTDWMFDSKAGKSRLADFVQPLNAGTFSLTAESGFTMAASIDFGPVDAGFLGGTASYGLTAADREANTESTFSVLSLQLNTENPNFGLDQAGFAFGDTLNPALLSLGRVSARSLQNNNTANLIFNVDNTNKLTAGEFRLNRIEVMGDTSIQSNNSIIFDAPSLVFHNTNLDLSAPYVQLGETSNDAFAQQTIAPVAGQGLFFVDADFLQLVGNFAISGTEQVTLLGREGVRYRSWVDPGTATTPATAANTNFSLMGNLLIGAPVLSGETLADYNFNLLSDDSHFELGQVGEFNAPLLSFGSSLTINSNTAFIDGNIHNPYGNINLNIAEQINLSSNAGLSVAGNGSTLFGRLVGDSAVWTYNFGSTSPVQFDRLPEKRIQLSSPTIIAVDGSQIDLSGGGEVIGREFVPGLGGTVDLLNNLNYLQSFAIVPTHQTGYSPVDIQEFNGSGIAMGSQVELTGSKNIADGTYTILPASYALLPGAYLVTPEKLGFNIAQGYSGSNLFGAEVVAGRFQTAGLQLNNPWTGFRVEPGSVINQRANYITTNADDFFVADLPGTRPDENGRLSLAVQTALEFNADVISSQAEIGSRIDLLVEGNVLVSDLENFDPDSSSFIGVLIDQHLFNADSADSILLGGSREWEDGAWQVTSLADLVLIDNADLSVNELLVTGNEIRIENGSTINAVGDTNLAGKTWQIDAASATLLISKRPGSQLAWEGNAAGLGAIAIDDTSQVLAQGAIGVAFDALNSINGVAFAGDTSSSSLQVLAESLVLGDIDAGAIVSSDLFQSAANVEIRTSDRLQFNASLAAEFNQLTIQTNQLQLVDGISVNLNANDSIALIGIGDSASLPVSNDTSINFSAPIISLSAQPSVDESFLGIASENVSLIAERYIAGLGNLRLQTGNDLHIETPLIVGLDKTDLTLDAIGVLTVNGGDKNLSAEAEQLTNTGGAIFHFTGTEISLDTRVAAKSGYIDIDATDGDLIIGDNAHFYLAPHSVRFPDEIRYGPGGILSATASGDLIVGNTSVFDFGSDITANGGMLELLALGNLELGSSTAEREWSSGGVDLRVVTNALSENSWQQLLTMNQGGIDGDINIMVTGVDEAINVTESQAITGQSVKLASLEGAVQIAGNIQSAGSNDSSQGNGLISIFGQDGISIEDTASLISTGNIWLEAPSASVTVAAGALLSAGKNFNIVKDRDDLITNIVVNSNDNINGKFNLFLAEQQLVTSSTNFAAAINIWITDLVAQVDATDVTGYVTSDADVNILPFLDLYATDDLVVTGTNIDLTTALTSQGLPGVLQLRSSGDLQLNTGINAATRRLSTTISGFIGGDTQILLPYDSWDVRVVAGAQSANAYAAVNINNGDSGNLIIGNSGFIQTGTGDITIDTAGDLTMLGGSYIASLGRADYLFNDITSESGSLLFAPEDLPAWGDRIYTDLYLALPDLSGFSRDGGDVTLNVGGGISGESDSQMSARFVQRLAVNTLNFGFGEPLGGVRTWTLAVDQIGGGIHAVGGGGLRVDAGESIHKVGFSTPGLGIGTDRTGNVQERINGGALNVVSRGDILETSFSNDGGSIAVRALRQLGGNTNDGIVIAASDSDIQLVGGQQASIGAILNTFIIPTASAQLNGKGGARKFLFGNAIDSVFYDNYDSTAFNVTAVDGDVTYLSSIDSVKKHLPNAEFENFYKTGDLLRVLSVLPSEVSFTALSRDVVFTQPLGIFPSSSANFTFNAYRNFYGAEIPGTETAVIRLPDIDKLVLANIKAIVIPESTISGYRGLNLGQSFFQTIDGVQPHANSIIARDKTAIISALTGDIGGPELLTIDSPNQLAVYTGHDIVNTDFRIQHHKSGQISTIRADNDIVFPVSFSNGNLTLGLARQRIELAGPGDLIVSAGGNIALGASKGILSVGNQLNNALPTQGGNLHVYAGLKGLGDLAILLGSGITSNSEILSISNLGSFVEDPDDLSIVMWLPAYINSLPTTQDLDGDALENYQSVVRVIAQQVGRATGKSSTLNSASEGDIDYNAVLAEAFNDWQTLNEDTQLRVSVSVMKELALRDPGFVVAKGRFLYAEPPLGVAGFTSQDERVSAQDQYWNVVGTLIGLEYLLTPNREEKFLQSFGGATSIASLSQVPIADLLTHVADYFATADASTQLLVAEAVMNDHYRQSSVEGAAAANALVNFERGYRAQNQFFGESYNNALIGTDKKVASILAGDNGSDIESINFGVRDGVELNDLQAVLNAWGIELPNIEDGQSGNINLIFSTIQTQAGGNVSVYAPGGSINVGLSAEQLEALNINRRSGELGILAFGLGGINSIVGEAFNVNESRTFSLAGGDINLWASYGDIDAGRGAKTAFSTPFTEFQTSTSTGLLTTIRPPAVSGSGIRTSASRTASSEALTEQRRFYEVAEGAGATFLSTPLGIVDAGEAGIESAGDLFIAAAQVRGADNINVGGVSVGVATSTAVGADVAGAGNVASAASEAVTESVTAAASGGQGAQDITAFITIELLDTGTE